jgi:hypothetical protein
MAAHIFQFTTTPRAKPSSRRTSPQRRKVRMAHELASMCIDDLNSHQVTPLLLKLARVIESHRFPPDQSARNIGKPVITIDRDDREGA